MYLIYRHLLLSAAGPFFFGLFTITFLMMIEILYKFVDLFVSKGIPFLLAAKVLGLSLGHMVALSIPMAVLISILMTIGQLAADQEITALKASGISLWTVLRPLLFATTLIAIGLTAYNHYIFPKSNHTLASLLYDINRIKPMMEIQEGRFTEMNDRMTIFVQKKDDLTGRIEDVSIFEKQQPGDLSPRLTMATWGMIIEDHANNAMLLELHNGEIHDRPDKEAPDKYQVIRFNKQIITINNAERDFKSSKRKSRSDREMDLNDLRAAAAREQKRQDEVGSHVNDLNTNLVMWQFQLLNPDKRLEILGKRPTPPEGKRREKFLDKKFMGLSMKVDRVVEQSEYQEKIRESYAVKKNRYEVEFHKKFAIPFACVVFAILGVPMAVTTSRSGKGISASMAIAVYLIYYLFLVGGERFADRGMLDPFLSMWAANILLLGIGIPVFFKSVRENTMLNLPWQKQNRQSVSSTHGSSH
jgi:lipopolysaccharide export system permease protein